jgi:cephalosporin-C deacetylase-like acetyl esterase
MRRPEAGPSRRRLLQAGALGMLWPLAGALAHAASEPAPASLCDLDWLMCRGDGPGRAEAEPERPEWTPINLGISWERQGLHGSEPVWLRKDVALPAGRLRGGLVLDLRLGSTSEVAVYCDGVFVGRSTEPGRVARFALPAAAAPGDRPLRLALRVIGWWWTGGVCDNTVRLLPTSGESPELWLSAQVSRPDHVFELDDKVSIEARLAAQRFEPARVTMALTSDFHAELLALGATLAAGTAAQRFDVGRLPPGFYQVVLRASQAGWHAQRVCWFGVAPSLVASRAQPVPGLEAYWHRARRELATVPPRFEATLDEQRSTARHRVYSVRMASVQGVTLRAWHIVPAKPGGARRPAVLHLPGYGEAMQPQRFMDDDDDMIHLALDIRGHGRSADVVHADFGAPGFLGIGLGDPERSVYRGACLDAGRALEFLATRADVDARRIAVAGGSQGGGLALAAAALYPERVAACVAGMPFLGAFGDHQRIRAVYRWEMQTNLDAQGGITWRDVERTMALVDTVNLAPRIRCPVLMGTGLFDDDCPPHIQFAAFNRITARKFVRLYPERGHDLGPSWQQDSTAWLRKQFALA